MTHCNAVGLTRVPLKGTPLCCMRVGLHQMLNCHNGFQVKGQGNLTYVCCLSIHPSV